MANPNLLGISNVVGVTTNIVIGTSDVGTGFQTVLSNASSSGKVLKLVSVLATNKTTGNATIDVNLNMKLLLEQELPLH